MDSVVSRILSRIGKSIGHHEGNFRVHQVKRYCRIGQKKPSLCSHICSIRSSTDYMQNCGSKSPFIFVEIMEQIT